MQEIKDELVVFDHKSTQPAPTNISLSFQISHAKIIKIQNVSIFFLPTMRTVLLLLNKASYVIKQPLLQLSSQLL